MTAAPANTRKIVAYSVQSAISGTNLNQNSFTGNGSAVAFTLSIAPVNENNTQVFLDGVYQHKSTYATSGTTLTFDTAPASGVAIEVMIFTQTEINVPVDDTITTAKIVDGAVTAAKLAAAQTNITSVGTLTALTVDDITIDGSTISDAADLGIASGGTLTVDVASQIILDADSGGDILLKDGGTDYGKFSILNGDWVLTQPTANKDILFKGNDGNALTALKLDMSASGAATFNAAVTIGGNLSIAPASNTPYISGGTVSTVFRNNANSASLIEILDNGNTTFNGEVTFNDDIGLGMNGAAFGTGVPTINFKGTSNANTRAGALLFKENNDDDVAALYITDGSDGYGTVLAAYQGDIKFSTGTLAGYKMTVKSDGKVGIGDSSPFSKLHVEDTGWSSGSPYGTVAYIEGGAVNDLNWGHLVVSQSGTTTDTGGRISFGANGQNPIAGIRAKYKGATYGDLAFLTRPSGGTNTQRMVIDTNGKIGIATDSPYNNAKLTVNGGLRFKTTPWNDGTALNVVSSNTYSNFNVANTITTVYYKCFILTIYSSAGYSQCFFIANAGAGTGFGFTVLRPDSATPVNGNLTSGFTVDVTGNGDEDFLVAVTYGGGSLSVKRTAANNQSSSWGVFVHVLSG